MIGFGKRPVFTPFHHVVFLMGMMGGTPVLELPMICDRRRKPVSGSWFMVFRPWLFTDGTILAFPMTGNAEFGIHKTEFGNVSLFHAGFQRVRDFFQYLPDGFVIYMRPEIVSHAHDVLRRTAPLPVNPLMFA